MLPYPPLPVPYISPYPMKKLTTLKPPDNAFQEALNDYFKTSKKSAFEEILDELFNQEEKINFLMSVGYEFLDGDDIVKTMSGNTKIRKGDAEFGWLDFDKLFVKEISIKFRNLLLAKVTLKLKI